MGVGDFWVVIFSIGFCFQVVVLSSQNVTCNSKDLRALEDFLKSLKSGITGWGSDVSSDCCTWVGVNCSSPSVGVENSTDSGKRVVRLELGSKKLKGNLSESLGSLDQLRFLNLSHNFFQGTVPSNLFHLQNLQVLDLSYNDFSGWLPLETDLPSLEYLDISENNFDGNIDTGICNNSTRIQVLNFSMNYFNGKFPLGFGNCSSLLHLCLSSNYLSGSLPQDIFFLAKLRKLYLEDNMISGFLSDGIGNLTNLIELDISFNNFSGPIPDVFSRLRELEHFSGYSNGFVGGLPKSLSNSPTLISLNLRNNSLGGLFNLNCSAMSSITSLDIGSNQFHGPILDILSSCKELRTINLARNYINSQIPESFNNLRVLSYLSLTNTSLHNLSAALGVLQQFRNLTTVVLTFNFLNEEIPSDASLHFCNLNTLIIPNCGLRGSIPTWLSNCTNLQLLDLSWNQLNGTIPDWLGELKFLFYMDLSNNSLSGVIPKSLTSLECLINGSISFEEPSSDFPFFIKRNQTGSALQYNQIGSFPPSLDLSNNMLTGPIWPEFGKLKKLLCLDLKWNLLSGHIPGELSTMTDLETLDLSHNNLSGTIPDSLVNLSFLSMFSVAYNQLSGRIPSGGQFLTFPNSSFEGNKDLCERSGPCPADQNSSGRTPKQSRKKEIIIGMAVGIGLGSIFLLILVVLIMSRPHRRTRNDPERECIDATGKDLEQSRLLVLFHKENNKELSIDDLLKSTNNFDQANIIGCGGFGLVYEATLPDGKKVAIKRLSGDDFGLMEREFQAEVEALSRAQHGNLVLLQGYCTYGNDKLLIYSYMKNGSLDYWLHEKLDGASSLDWEARLRIAQGVARGLAYLHQSCQPHILHRDIKSSNILLDESFEAHLADFGLARLILPYDTHVTTDLVGTLGYIPPEYGQASVATYKGDVYSFGVVLLELLTGKRPVDMCKPEGCRNLISWVLQMKKEKRESEVFDPFIYDKENDKEMLRVLEIACLCLDESPKMRPSTEKIVLWLDDVVVNG